MNNEINIGDTVLYIDTNKHGVWDGEKVVLNDKDKTIVRNKAWLTVTHELKYQTTEFLLDELINNGWQDACNRNEEITIEKEIKEIKKIILERLA